jgi:outer membrane receptor for ferrienterochelin and colicin
MELPDRDIPSQISVVTQQTLQKQGLHYLASALENVSGVSVQVQYGVYEWHTIDGFAQLSGNDFLYINGMTLRQSASNTTGQDRRGRGAKGSQCRLAWRTGGVVGGMVNVSLAAANLPWP